MEIHARHHRPVPRRAEHTLEVRGFDGTTWSDPYTITFFVDQPPTVTVTVPAEGEKYKDLLEVAGTALDDLTVTKVEIRIDNGTWITVNGTTDWDHELETKDLDKGEHTLEARSYDGESYSDIYSVSFEVEKKKKDDGPGFMLPLVILSLIVVASALVLRRRR
jgi:hypothetical protein